MRLATLLPALSLVLAAVSGQAPAAQPASRYQDLAAELAARIATTMAPADRAWLSVAMIDEASQGGADQLRGELAQALSARGVRLVESAESATVVVRASCHENLRERACVADIQKGTARQVVAAARPLDARADRAARPSLETQRLVSQRAPILDAVLAGDGLVVLDPASVTRYRRGDDGWERVESQPITTARIWPRDVRGRLHVEAGRDVTHDLTHDVTHITAFLPGVVCRSASDGTRLACVDDRQPWPIGLENSGIEANRNYFLTPEGLAFFGAAPLVPDAGARWLAAGTTGALLLLDESRRSVATLAAGDDVVALNAPCTGPVVLVASAGRNGPDTLRLFRAVYRQLVPAAAPLELPGRFTALWTAAGGTAATAVAHDAGAERYEALQVRIACDR
jgi:hypothetical protein